MQSYFLQAQSIAGCTQLCCMPTNLGGMPKAIFDAVDGGAQKIHCQNTLLMMLQDFSAVLILSVRRDFSPVLHYEFNTMSMCTITPHRAGPVHGLACSVITSNKITLK